jgi:hypothetical protein
MSVTVTNSDSVANGVGNSDNSTGDTYTYTYRNTGDSFAHSYRHTS